jgi:excisionase family DNA binding protein
MPYKLNKIIIQRDNFDDYETHIRHLDYEIDSPYAAGKLKDLIPIELQHNEGWKLELIPTHLFNESGLTKLTPEVGPKGIYYLELRPGYKLKQLIVEPEDVVVDIYVGAEERLIYSFYNPTRRNNIIITAASEKDKDNVHAKLKSDLSDIIMRKYFIKCAMIDTEKFFSNLPAHKEVLKEKSILTAEEAAKYIRTSKKNVQNLASQGKIKKVKGGKYRLEDLDSYLNGAPKKKK